MQVIAHLRSDANRSSRVQIWIIDQKPFQVDFFVITSAEIFLVCVLGLIKSVQGVDFVLSKSVIFLDSEISIVDEATNWVSGGVRCLSSQILWISAFFSLFCTFNIMPKKVQCLGFWRCHCLKRVTGVYHGVLSIESCLSASKEGRVFGQSTSKSSILHILIVLLTSNLPQRIKWVHVLNIHLVFKRNRMWGPISRLNNMNRRVWIVIHLV